MWCFALPQCASDSTFEHRKAGTTQHCRGNHFFVFLVYGRNKQDDVGLVSTSRRLYFGEASLQSPGACTSKSIQYYFIVDLDVDFFPQAVDGNLPPVTHMFGKQHLWKCSILCTKLLFFCFALLCLVQWFHFCNFVIILLFHFYMLSKNLGLQFLDGWRGQNKL